MRHFSVAQWREFVFLQIRLNHFEISEAGLALDVAELRLDYLGRRSQYDTNQ